MLNNPRYLSIIGLLTTILLILPCISQAGGPAPILGGFYVHSLNDRWKLGASLTSITGAQFVYADYGKAKIDNNLLKSDYKRNALFFFAINAN